MTVNDRIWLIHKALLSAVLSLSYMMLEFSGDQISGVVQEAILLLQLSFKDVHSLSSLGRNRALHILLSSLAYSA